MNRNKQTVLNRRPRSRAGIFSCIVRLDILHEKPIILNAMAHSCQESTILVLVKFSISPSKSLFFSGEVRCVRATEIFLILEKCVVFLLLHSVCLKSDLLYTMNLGNVIRYDPNLTASKVIRRLLLPAFSMLRILTVFCGKREAIQYNIVESQ